MNKHVAMRHRKVKLAVFPATVTVTISGNPPTFALSSTDIPVQKFGDDYMLTFNNTFQKGDGFDVTFTIEDQTGKGYGFFQDLLIPSPDDAMSVKVAGSNGHCPKSNQKWSGFSPSSVSADRQSMIVNNPNKHLQYFGFALYFSVKDETKPSLTYDPIGNNQDGNSAF